jgi:hypothetical protein
VRRRDERRGLEFARRRRATERGSARVDFMQWRGGRHRRRVEGGKEGVRELVALEGGEEGLGIARIRRAKSSVGPPRGPCFMRQWERGLYRPTNLVVLYNQPTMFTV